MFLLFFFSLFFFFVAGNRRSRSKGTDFSASLPVPLAHLKQDASSRLRSFEHAFGRNLYRRGGDHQRPAVAFAISDDTQQPSLHRRYL